MEPIFEGRNHMYKVEKKNRVLRIPDEKFDEYKKMGYIIRDENDNGLIEPENIKACLLYTSPRPRDA